MGAAKDYIVVMRNAVRVPLCLLAFGAVLSAGQALGSDASPAAQPSPVASPSSKRLRLGPYVDPYAPVPVERMFDVPRFDTRVEVHGKAMDRVALTARMEWWMRDFEPMRGAVSRAGSAPSLAE